MDLRIVNTCNNNCLYCLEQPYRDKKKYLDINTIFSMIEKQKKDKIIGFYGGNPLLHPKIQDIIYFCKDNGFESIGILTNTYSLDKESITKLVDSGLTTIGFYFNSFDNDTHDKIVNGGISLPNLISNIELIKKTGINYKAIIHINNQNINNLYKDIVLLNKKYLVNNFEFVNYFPFDRPYEKFRKLLEYKYNENRKYIDLAFSTIEKLKLDTRFSKFSKDFFGKYTKFYDYKNGILNHIAKEDKKRIENKNPFCLLEKRCDNCFIKDKCSLTDKNENKEQMINIPTFHICNQKCIFCSDLDKKEHLYLKDNIDRYVYKSIDYGITKNNNLMFSTGEPTLNNNLYLYIKYAKKIGYKKVGVITNGTIIGNDKLRKKIMSSGLDEIIFSIHGSNSKVHDYNTGLKGSFDRALEGITKFIKESKDITIYTSFVLNNHNLYDLYNYVYKFYKLGVSKIIINTMRPEGYGLINIKELFIKYEKFIDYINSLGGLKVKFINELIKDNKLVITDIPICILIKAEININSYTNNAKREILDSGKYSLIDVSNDKIYLEKCSYCSYKNMCEGIYKKYIDFFGDKEFFNEGKKF